jgi:TPR repeat protein
MEVLSREESFEEYRRRATLGDTEALFYVAWEYFKGEVVPKNIELAIASLRQLEETSPQLARFNIAKMKYLVRDSSLGEDLKADCDAGFGPALYLMAAHSYREGGKTGTSDAIRYFRAAAQGGHLESKIWLWRLSNRGFWRRLATAGPVFLIALRFIAIKLRDSNDVRIWS